MSIEQTKRFLEELKRRQAEVDPEQLELLREIHQAAVLEAELNQAYFMREDDVVTLVGNRLGWDWDTMEESEYHRRRASAWGYYSARRRELKELVGKQLSFFK